MAEQPILVAQGLGLSLPNRAEKRTFGKPPLTEILKDVDLTLDRGETLGIVGESGSGKTSLGRALLRLHEPTVGKILFEGRDITHADANALRPLRSRLQMIFQDPQSSLNPRHKIGRIVTQPLRIHGRIKSRTQARFEAAALLDRVGLPGAFTDRYPHQLSGGQRQRVGIARAIALCPTVVVADEIVSGLDVSSQAQILNLLRELKRELGLALIFISHDLSVIRILCDRTLVLWRGRVVEAGATDRIFESPQHDYTRMLLAAIPLPDVDPGWIDSESPVPASSETIL